MIVYLSFDVEMRIPIKVDPKNCPNNQDLVTWAVGTAYNMYKDNPSQYEPTYNLDKVQYVDYWIEKEEEDK